VKKFEARKTSIHLQHKTRTLGTSAQALPSAAVALRTNQQHAAAKREASRSRAAGVPALALPNDRGEGTGARGRGTLVSARSAASSTSRSRGARAAGGTPSATPRRGTSAATPRRRVPLNMTQPPAMRTSALATSRKATEEMLALMKQVFRNVLEAFVFFDMEGADVIRAQVC
jgi:hypothetical protein